MANDASPDLGPTPAPPGGGELDFGVETEALRRVARGILREQADQDDVIQETWLAYLESKQRARDPEAWRKGVLRMLVRGRYRTERERRTVPLVEPPETVEPASAPLEQDSVRELLRRALRELSPPEAEVIGARFAEDLSVAEICARTGRPLGTVKSQLQRGLARLRAHFDRRTGDPRLTGLALIQAFDWKREDVLPAVVPVGLGASLLLPTLVGAVLLFAVGLVFTLSRIDRAPELVDGPRSGPAVAGSPETAMTSEPNDAVATRAADERVAASDGASPEAAREPAEEAVAETPAATRSITLVGLDGAGAPLPGFWASIWNGGSFQTRTGAAGVDGRLEIPIQENFIWVQERGPALGASDASLIRITAIAPHAGRPDTLYVPCPPPGTQREVVVRFDRPRVEITGRLVDPSGRGISGASLYSGGEFQLGEMDGDVYRVDEISSWWVENDGAFELPYETPGRNFLQAQAPGYVRGTWVLDSTGKRRMEVTLTLQPAVEVAGVVRDLQGRPVAGVEVFAEAQELYPQDWAVSDADGSFLLEGLLPGPHRLWAIGVPGPDGARKVAAAEVEGRGGERLVWDPVLEPSEGICIEVVDADGAPRAGQALLVLSQDDPTREWREQTYTGADGRVRFYRDPGGPAYAVLYGGAFEGELDPLPFAIVRDLRPRAEPYRVHLFAEDLDLGSFRGRVLGHDGRPVGGGSLNVVRRAIGPLWQPIPSVDGEFHLERAPRGEYVLRLHTQRGGAWSKRFELAAGQHLDLGELRTPPPGTLRVENTWPLVAEGLPYSTVVAIEVEGFDGPGLVFDSPTEDRLGGEFQVLPGHLRLTVQHGPTVVQRVEVDVRSGEVTVVRLGPE